MFELFAVVSFMLATAALSASIVVLIVVMIISALVGKKGVQNVQHPSEEKMGK